MNAEQQLKTRIEAAQGKIPCDLVIKDVSYFDVFFAEWRKGDVSVIDGFIVGLEPGLRAKRTIDGRGKFLVPGFIDAHVHIESSLLLPDFFQQAVLPHGTTTAICDPHELANVVGTRGLRYFLEAAERLELDLRVMLSSCVPATNLETNGGGRISGQDLVPFLDHPRTVGLAEVMDFPGVLSGSPEVLSKLSIFKNLPKDGHCPLLSGNPLSAYISAGIANDHECSSLDEAREKITKGMTVFIREGSVAKNLRDLAPLLTLNSSSSIGFCTDDRNPKDIAEQGHIDHLIRTAIQLGVQAEAAYRSASWSVAKHYGLKNLGAIAPGYIADLVLLDRVETCAVREVFRKGRPVSEINFSAVRPDASIKGTVRARLPQKAELEGPEGRVNVITIQPGQILTGREITDYHAKGVAKISVLERHGNHSKPANGYVRGFGDGFRGAIASSIAHDSHNLIVVGDNTEDMVIALRTLIESDGGLCVVRDQQVVAKLELPYAGLMSDLPPQKIKESLDQLHSASRLAGCTLDEPFLQLAFLSLPVIPALKLTDKGLVDVNSFKLIDVRAD